MSEISSLRAKQTELQNELKIKTEELSSHKQSLAESVSDNKILKFRLEKDESVLSESKVMVNEFRAEITNSQHKYLEVKRELDNHRFSQDEQYLLMDQLRHEVLIFFFDFQKAKIFAYRLRRTPKDCLAVRKR